MYFLKKSIVLSMFTAQWRGIAEGDQSVPHLGGLWGLHVGPPGDQGAQRPFWGNSVYFRQ